MAKQQTGLRIERVLFKQFQDLCSRERLRPGEAVESLMRGAVELGSVVAVSSSMSKPDNPGRSVDRMVFRSRLSRMKSVLEEERKYLEKVGTMDPYGISSNLSSLEHELSELGRKGIDGELLREFGNLLTEFDRLYGDVEKNRNEERIEEERTEENIDEDP